VHEVKYDGYRMQARIDGRDIKIGLVPIEPAHDG
jgi:hypothetical protein